MPAAKMVADSTQSDAALERRKKRHDSKDYHRKNKKDHSRSKRCRSPHRNSSSSRRSTGSHSQSEKSTHKEESKAVDDDDDSDDSDMDLSKPLKALSSYITNRKELLDQMFQCIKGNTLKRAIPHELQCLSYEELKQRCLAQLEVMSKKRILRILAGDDPANISSSGTEESGDDPENNDKNISRSTQEFTQPCSHPADSTSSTSTKPTKADINTNNNLFSVSPSNDAHLLPQPVTMSNLDHQSSNHQADGYSRQTMDTCVSTSYPKSHATNPHWPHQSDQASLINLSTAEAGQLQTRSHISDPLLPSYRHTLKVDCSDFPISIANPAQSQKGKVSIHASSQADHHQQHHQQQTKTQQRNAVSCIRPFACSGSDYCICGRCTAPALLSQTSAAASLSVAATDIIADTHSPKMQGSGGAAIAAKEQAVPARILARTQMEILELEMRARAIKAMLHAASQCHPVPSSQQQQQQPPPSL